MVYFVRHGESEANLNEVFAGQREDSLLTNKGREEAKAVAKALHHDGLHFDKIISSPLKRAKETADIISKEIDYNCSIEIDNSLTEYDFGNLTGQKKHKISSLELVSSENAEDPEEFYNRVHSSIKKLSQLHGNILVVGHGGFGKMLEAIKIGVEHKLFFDLPHYPNAFVIKIDWIK